MKPPRTNVPLSSSVRSGFILCLLTVVLAAGSATGHTVEPVADLKPLSGGSFPLHLTTLNNQLYFTADDGVYGRELWKFDGDNLYMIDDANPGSGGSDFRDLIEYNGILHFYGDDGLTRGLWASDGSSVWLAAEVNPGTDHAGTLDYIVFNGELYFESRDFSPGPHLTGAELWKYDGIDAALAVDIEPGPDSSYPGRFIQFNGSLFFSASRPGGSGKVLWQFDGSSASVAAYVSQPQQFTEYKGNLYFQSDETGGAELWRYDGDTASLVDDLNPGSSGSGPAGLTVYQDNLYFSARSSSLMGDELWMFDGETISLAAEINTNQTYPFGSDPSGFTVLYGNLYFSADDGAHGRELWMYDGSVASLVADINPGPDGSNPRHITVYDDALYFMADDGALGAELWRMIPDSDGDGIPDGEDPSPHSIVSDTVVIGDCDSGVENIFFDDGNTLADLIQACADDAKNHGRFVSGVTHLTKEMKREGILTKREASNLISCAGRSDVCKQNRGKRKSGSK